LGHANIEIMVEGIAVEANKNIEPGSNTLKA
jgi:hypothetical protein